MSQVSATYKDIWRIAYPIMLSSVAQTVLNVTDTAFLARVGEVELGASAISGVFYFVMVMIGVSISIGIQILIARKAGEKDHNAIGIIFDNGVVILFSLGLLLFIISHFVAVPLYEHIIQQPDIREASITFLQYRSYGLLVTVPFLTLRGFYIGIAQTKIIISQSVLMAVLNIVFDYTLIFGHFGFDAMGIKGAGIATASAEIISGIFVFVYTFFHKDVQHFNLFRFIKISKNEIARIFHISSPLILQYFLSMGAWFVFFVLIEKLGAHELAISNVIRSSYMMLATPIWGFSSAANSMVSNLIGQKKFEDVFVVLRKIISLSLFVMVPLTVLFALFPQVLLHLTTSDPKLINDSIGSFYIICLSTIIFSISMNLLNGVSGTGATRAAMYIEIINIAIYLIYIYLCCIFFKTKIEIVWVSELLYWTIMGILSYWYLKKGHWRGIEFRA